MAGSEKQIFCGNLLLIACCTCYLAWWLLAFKPVGAVRGMASGWLLIPAFAAGVGTLILTIRGIGAAGVTRALFPERVLLWGGVAAYLILMAVTLLMLKRPITTELILIVGWAVLALAEVNALYGTGRFGSAASHIFAAVIAAATFLNLICYVLYYSLDSRAGYFDGMIPLLLAELITAGISVCMAV